MSARPTVNKPTQRARAPGGELAQVQGAGLAGQAAAAGQVPGEAERPGSVKTGWIAASAVEGAQ
jgi:hypothetical protein